MSMYEEGKQKMINCMSAVLWFMINLQLKFLYNAMAKAYAVNLV